jgi:glycosyltransferase involved in cell wall biosynthesis
MTRFVRGGTVQRKPIPEIIVKFALVSHVLPPSWSGQSVMIGRILKYLSPEQYCLISTENYQSEKDRNTGFLPGKYFSLPREPKFFRLGSKHWLATWPQALIRGLNIARIVKQEKCNIIVAASGNLIDMPAGWWASVLTGTGFVPYLFDDYLYQWPDKQTRSITRKVERRIYGHVKSVIVPNEFMRDEIQKRQNVKATIVRNPCASIPENRIRPVRVGYDLKADIRIVYTGAIYHVNFEAFKNLIAATNQFSAHLKIHLYTAQPPEWLTQNGIQGEQIVHHPHSIHAEILEAQNQAHILFLPFSFNSSIPEVIQTSAPGKTAEYLTSGVPVLVHVPPDTFVSWYFRKHDCGYVVDKNDSDSLKRAIDNLIQDPDLRERLVMNAQERARVDFDPVTASKAFLQAMDAAL